MVTMAAKRARLSLQNQRSESPSSNENCEAQSTDCEMPNAEAAGESKPAASQETMASEFSEVNHKMRELKKEIRRAKKQLQALCLSIGQSEAASRTEEEQAARDATKAERRKRRELRRANKAGLEAKMQTDEITHDPAKPLKFHTVQFKPPTWCVPIRADVTDFDFEALSKATQFDVIHMDPPWQLASATPTRGVALGYSQLNDQSIADMPVQLLSKSGFIFIWVINARFEVGMDLMKRWGYRFIDQIDWVKQTVNRRLAKSHGYYLQHVKETCIVGVKGDIQYDKSLFADVIFSQRRGQSQKPEEVYHLIESLVPNGKYLEIFARRNNLRDYWVSIGNEL